MEMNARPVLVFDMDGVLVDVSESYRETIRQTVLTITGRDVSRDAIQDYKNSGGWNNDWALSQKICADYGVEVPYGEVVSIFQRLFLGSDWDGLMLRERWLPSAGLLDRLAARHYLAIFTGRPRDEASFTLSRFAPGIPWSIVVADEDVANSKPAPDGLLQIAEKHSDSELIYFGDTVDDAMSARAAGVRFIGVAHGRLPKRDTVVRLLHDAGADTVIGDLEEIERTIGQACAKLQ